MKKDRIHIYEMESYKHASEEQRNSMRICKIRYFDLEGLPSREVKEILEAFIWERGKTLALSSLATELTTYNNIRKFLIEKNITVLQNADPEKTVRILKGWMLEKGLALSSMKYRVAYDITARETPALERKLRQILKFAEVKDEREEQEKDIWELEKFEFPIRRNPIKNVKTLNFTDILQPDIREEVKRVIFLHLKYSALGTIHSEMTAVKRFSRFLKSRKPELESLQELSREDIEDYLIYLQTETTERKNYRSDLYGLKRVIEDVGNIYERRHLLELFLNNDFPSTPRYQFKFYSDATIKRLNSHIFNLDEQIARALIVHQLLGTRISDTLTLRMDCLREKEGRYFVRIDQVKSITYEKAVSNEVGRLILKAMEYTKERYGETEYVFVKKDDPSKPYQYGMIQAQVMRMIRQKDIRDDNGELLKFGTHIFRHCYGKKLTELHIEDWMIARLLGHKTLQSVHHYRRIGNKVMADETRKTREKMDLILMDIIKDGMDMNYEKMIAVNRIESEQKIKLATMAIEQLIERGEYPSVTLLVKKTGLSRGFFYKNPEVRSRLDAAVQSPNVSCRRIWSGSKDSKNDNTEVLQMEIMEYKVRNRSLSQENEELRGQIEELKVQVEKLKGRIKKKELSMLKKL